MTYAQKYKSCLKYIDSYWDKIIVKPDRASPWKKLIITGSRSKKSKEIWNVPNAFVTPNDKKFKHLFYWDSFFMLRGMIGTKREWLLKDMVDNFIYLFNNYGVIPNFNSPASSGRSQPPLLTSMIIDTYNGPYYRYMNKNRIKRRIEDRESLKDWLINAYEVAKREYFEVWDDPDNLFYHKIPETGLNRYGDRDVGYAHSSELESGWDFTSRFYNRCNEFLPIDLNSMLYKYEIDFAKISEYIGDKKESDKWIERSNSRKALINKYLWNESDGFFFDHNYKHNRQSNFLSLAGFVPLWAGLATKEQAEKMVKKLKYFETKSGLVITAKESLAPKADLSDVPIRYRVAVQNLLNPKQWDYPYVWPPVEYLVVTGLLKYGYFEEAKRIMQSSLSAWSKIFEKHNTFFEKRNALSDDLPSDFHYANQSGFGWTNAVFYRYVQILDSLDRGESFLEIEELNDENNNGDRHSSLVNKLLRKSI